MLAQLSAFPVIAFEGSRALPAAAGGLVAQLVGAVLASGGRVATGCCVGSDAAVISAVLRAGAAPRLSVFAAYGPGGAGSCSLSAVPVVAAAAAAGASVGWWAGGPVAVPLRARLARRSGAVVRAGAALVLVQPGAGSLAAALPVALRAGLPVFCFAAAAPSSGPAWSSGSFAGLPCWCWAPALAQVALF